MIIRFDDAWRRSVEVATELTEQGLDVVLSRDLVGRITLIVESADTTSAVGREPTDLGARIADAAGPFASAQPAVTQADTGLAPEFFAPPRTTVLRERDGERGRLSVMDNVIVGSEWQTIADAPPKNRVTLYSYKGGVGRSTATFMLANGLAERGRCVLVVDLDLESPGVGNLLLPAGNVPDHGVADFLVESAVGNESGLDLVGRSPGAGATTGGGEVWVATAAGRPRDGYHYLPKLNRAYLDTPDYSFAQRLDAAIKACEVAVGDRSRQPDHVLLDSRAGIHDIAAVAITDLSDLSLLFAIDSPQTWTGYRELFGQWAGLPHQAQSIRSRLRMVATMVPAARQEKYLAVFRDHAQDCFASTLYDNAGPDDEDAFSPAVDDHGAPHSPVPILFNTDLVGLDVSTNPDWHRSELVRAAYRDFIETVVDILPGGSR